MEKTEIEKDKKKKISQKKVHTKIYKSNLVYYPSVLFDLECDLHTQQTDITFSTGINCK